MTETGEMKTESIDIENYRRLVKNYIDMRRYKSALFWAEKVSVLSNEDPRDVFNLAQCMFLLREYNRAAHIIRSRGLEKTNIFCHYLLAECLLEAQEYQEALDLSCVDVEELSMHDSNVEDEEMKNEFVAAIYLLKGKIFEAMDNRSLAMDCYVQALQKSVYCTEALDALVDHEMLMAWEEKELMDHLPFSEQCTAAEEKLLRSLYESKLKKYYDSLVPQSNPNQTPISSMSANLLKEFTDKMKTTLNTDFKTLNKTTNPNLSSKLLTPQPVNPIMSPANKLLDEIRNSPYSIHSSLSKIINESHKNDSTHRQTRKKAAAEAQTSSASRTGIELAVERLSHSVDMMSATAEKYFYNCEYRKCTKILEKILQLDPYHKRTLTVQIGCLVELKDFNKLFYVAHKLVDLYPDESISWYAVGSYYDLIGKSDPARRFLQKATTLDRLYGPAWLAFGHSFAKENEHDQAMAAYFKATQLMRGCHLPLLYIGVECGLTKNLEMAEKFFFQAMSIAPLDVFVLHELGCIKFEHEMYENAEEYFRTTLDMITSMAKRDKEPISSRWEPLLNNLGHCCRKNKKYAEALEFHKRALVLKPQCPATYTAIGFVQALMGKLEEAVESFHKSLALKRDDAVTTTILKYVIEDLMEEMDVLDLFTGEATPKTSTTSSNNETSGNTPIKLNCMKLKFDDDSNVSQNSDTVDASYDMSMDV